MTAEQSTTHDGGPIAVVGASGQQGGAVVSALLKRGKEVRALVRDPTADRAKYLLESGAELVRANLDEPASLVDAVRGSAAVFSMTTFAGAHGADGEVEHGHAIGDAVVAADVPRIVYSSVGGAERSSGIPHFESKRRVEEYLATLDLTTTFIRPTFFMENFASFFQPTIEGGTLVVRLPIPSAMPLQMISTHDIGEFAAMALINPDTIPDGAIEIAGDEVTGEEMAAAFGKAKGTLSRYEALPVNVLPNEDQKLMFTWFAHLPAYQADLARCRGLLPALRNLGTWIEGQN